MNGPEVEFLFGQQSHQGPRESNQDTVLSIQLPDDPDISYTKHDSTHARFKLSLPPQTKRAFTYTVTTYLGQREQAADK